MLIFYCSLWINAVSGLTHCQHVVPKTVTFPLKLDSEIIENARYEMQTIDSMANLQLGNEAIGRTDE